MFISPVIGDLLFDGYADTAFLHGDGDYFCVQMFFLLSILGIKKELAIKS